MRFYIFCLTVVTFFFLNTSTLFAKLIEPEGLLQKIIESYSSVSQFRMKTRVRIYNPEAFLPLEEEHEELLLPRELSENGFRQSIFWVRDEYFGIETTNLKKKPLNFLFQEGGKEVFKSLQEERFFHPEDLLYPHLIFYTKHTSWLKKGLYSTGVAPIKVAMKEGASRIVYQFGSETENIVVDQDRYLILEINSQLQIRGRYYPYKIVFQDWDETKRRIPKTTRFYINNRLFKEIRVISLQFRGIWRERNRFLKKYRGHFPKNKNFPLDLKVAR